jgi:hypothetical protein
LSSGVWHLAIRILELDSQKLKLSFMSPILETSGSTVGGVARKKNPLLFYVLAAGTTFLHYDSQIASAGHQVVVAALTEPTKKVVKVLLLFRYAGPLI